MPAYATGPSGPCPSGTRQSSSRRCVKSPHTITPEPIGAVLPKTELKRSEAVLPGGVPVMVIALPAASVMPVTVNTACCGAAVEAVPRALGEELQCCAGACEADVRVARGKGRRTGSREVAAGFAGAIDDDGGGAPRKRRLASCALHRHVRQPEVVTSRADDAFSWRERRRGRLDRGGGDTGVQVEQQQGRVCHRVVQQRLPDI